MLRLEIKCLSSEGMAWSLYRLEQRLKVPIFSNMADCISRPWLVAILPCHGGDGVSFRGWGHLYSALSDRICVMAKGPFV